MKVRRTAEGDIEVLLEGADLNRLERDLTRSAEFEDGKLSLVVDHTSESEARVNQHTQKGTW